jgi:transmembrane sensor
MKTPQQENAQKPSATEIDLRAADWLQRRAFWNWGQDEQASLDLWLAESRAHRVAYWRQNAVWDSAQRLIALRSSAPRQDHPVTENRKPFIFRAVAVAVVAMGAAVSFYLLRTHENQTVYATKVGGRQTVTLADGSQIELNTDTVLRLRTNADNRLAILEKGEAFFSVKHNATHPFVVDAAGHRVTDLGTKFSIRNTPDRLEVSLIEGRARFESANKLANMPPAVLSPGDVVIATARTTTITKKPGRDLINDLGWRHGMLTFYRVTVADAASEFNRYNERKIVVADKAAASELIDGTFPTTDVDLFGRIARSVLGLQVKNEDGEIVISR